MLDRRTFLPLLPAALHTGRAGAAAAPLKLAHSAPVDHPLHLRLLQAARLAQQDAGGALTVHIHPTDQLGSQQDVLDQVRARRFDEAALAERSDMAALDVSTRELLRSKGLRIADVPTGGFCRSLAGG